MTHATSPPYTAAKPARRGELSERALGLFLLAPMTMVLLLVIAYPLLDSLMLSLYRVNLANPEQGQPFVSLGNYLYAFKQPAFWYAVERTLYFTVLSVALELGLGLLFAILLNESFRRQLPARLAMVAPWALLTVSRRIMGLDPQSNLWHCQYGVGQYRYSRRAQSLAQRHVLDHERDHSGRCLEDRAEHDVVAARRVAAHYG